MNYLKQLLPNELIYHNPINNQFNLVCDIIVKNIGIYNSKFKTALIRFFQKSLIGKANGLILKIVKITKLSNAIRQYTSNKPNITLLTEIYFENNETSIQQDYYLRIGQEIKTYISNGNSCKCVIFKDKLPEKEGIYPNNTFRFMIPNTTLSLSSTKNNIKFKKLDIDTKTFIYPKASLRNLIKFIKRIIQYKKLNTKLKKN